MNIWYALIISLVINMGMFLIAYRNKTDKLTDISYAATFIILTAVGFVTSSAMITAKWIVTFMVYMWAVRIGTFLYMRIQKSGRDGRFDSMRSDFKKFSRFWLLQAVTVWVVISGVIVFYSDGRVPITGFMIVGVVLWLSGFVIETIADWQKYQFSLKKKNKDKWIASGLWKYSRHPNYFGEILVWFGIYVFVVSGLEGVSQLVAMISPLFITFLLLFVSGVPLLEKSADVKWGKQNAYKKYKANTSVLIPLPSK